MLNAQLQTSTSRTIECVSFYWMRRSYKQCDFVKFFYVWCNGVCKSAICHHCWPSLMQSDGFIKIICKMGDDAVSPHINITTIYPFSFFFKCFIKSTWNTIKNCPLILTAFRVQVLKARLSISRKLFNWPEFDEIETIQLDNIKNDIGIIVFIWIYGWKSFEMFWNQLCPRNQNQKPKEMNRPKQRWRQACYWRIQIIRSSVTYYDWISIWKTKNNFWKTAEILKKVTPLPRPLLATFY